MTEPAFVPKPGQMDFTHARWAPVINCVVKFQDKILLVQRNASMKFYPGFWNGISGFLDDAKSIEEKIEEELREELSISKEHILKIQKGDVFDQDEPAYAKTWIVHPVLVEIDTEKIKLDWEAQTYQWITPGDAVKLQLLPGFDQVIKNLSVWL